MLCSCTSQKENEEEAILKVAVHSEEYKTSLVELWNETFPENELIVEVVKEEEIETKLIQNETLDYDVYWIEDAYVPLVIDGLLELDDEVEVSLNTNFNEIFNIIKEVYQPLMALSDTYYALDLNVIESKELNEDSFNEFESMSEIESSFYYLDELYFTKYFLYSNLNYFPNKEYGTINFNSDDFINALNNYRKIYELMPINDKSSFDNWFINNSYASGFITTSMQYEKDEEVNGGKYKITKLPTINNQQLYMEANSYGYVVNMNTEYPNAAKNLIKLMHSKKGVQLLCNSDDFVPLINESMMDEFAYVNEHLKEKTYAMNYMVSRCFIGMNEKETTVLDYLFLEDTINKLKTCNLENVEACQLELDESYQEWLK